MKLTIISIISLFLLGCSAAGVPHTNDPAEKVNYAYQLKDLGRPIPAQDLLNEALHIYKSTNDRKGMARTNIALGDLYKSPSYRSNADIFKRWGEYKSYDDIPAYYETASRLYEEAGEVALAGVAKTSKGAVEYHALNNIEMACKSFAEAKRFQLESKPSPAVNTLNSMLEHFQSHKACE